MTLRKSNFFEELKIDSKTEPKLKENIVMKENESNLDTVVKIVKYLLVFNKKYEISLIIRIVAAFFILIYAGSNEALREVMLILIQDRVKRIFEK